MKKYYLTQDANTGRGPLTAGADISGLYDSERVALCLMGKAVAVDEADAPAKQAEILAEVAAEQEARAEQEAELTAAIDAIQMVQNELDTLPEAED